MGLLSKAVSSDISQTGEKIAAFVTGAFAKSSAWRFLVFETKSPPERINNMVSDFASILEIKAGRCLLLCKPSFDCELLSHRLAASTGGREILSFSAGNPREAQAMLKRCL